MRYRLLLVEDDASVRAVAEACLAMEEDLEVLTAPSGEDALVMARAERPDGILLDLMMPGMDGMAVLQELRRVKDTAAIPVVFLTAKVQRTETDRLRASGARAVLAKPFDPLTLALDVRGAFGWQGL